MLQYLRLTPKIEANIFALGLTTIFVLGSLTLIVAMVAALWLAFQAVVLLLTSVVECCSTIGTLYSGADPLVRLLILVILGYVIYRIVTKVRRTK